MKELSIEEKAKRYDEAIEKAEKWHNAPNVDKIPTFGNRIIEDIFPELYESENERIRKELIEHVKDQQSSFISAPDCRDKYEEEENNKYNSWIAWLEKQGELVNSLSKGLDNAHERIDELIQKNNKLCIKLEQKPAWTEEDEKILKDILVDVKFEGYNNDMLANSYKKINWLKSLKERIGG